MYRCGHCAQYLEDLAHDGDEGGAGLRVEEAAAGAQSPGVGGGVQDGGARAELTGRTSVETSGVQLCYMMIV